MKTVMSARVDEQLASFLEHYQKSHGLKSRSEALEAAIRALRDKALEAEYAVAMDEWEASGEEDVWDVTVGDGLIQTPAATTTTSAPPPR